MDLNQSENAELSKNSVSTPTLCYNPSYTCASALSMLARHSCGVTHLIAPVEPTSSPK